MVRHLPALFLFLSGAASLIYQVTWVRLLSLSIGSTSVSVGIVLATFFLGLALGSFLTTRLPAHRLTTLTPYLILEVVIGISAILLLPVLLNLDWLITYWPPLGQLFLFKVVLVVLTLAIPSICIGATYPLMVSLVVREPSSIGQRLGWLYSLNTAGAVCGAAGVGFLLIPLWGLDGAIYFASGLNFIVVIVGLLYWRHFKLPAVPEQAAVVDRPLSRQDRNILLVLFVTGLSALACQVAWTKYLAIFVHTTIFGFSALLSITLLGIALGAWWMKCSVDRLANPLHWVVGLLCGLALVVLLSRGGLQYLPSLYELFSGPADGSRVPLIKYLLITLVLLPANILFGALFTLNMRLFCGPLTTLQRRAGTAYAVNTLGGLVGALLAGLWLIPLYGSDRVLLLMGILIMLTPLLFWFDLPTIQRQRLIMPSLGLVMLGLPFAPALDFRQVINHSLYHFDPASQSHQQPEFRFIEEGRSSVISVTTYDGQLFRLQNNSLPEAIISSSDQFPWRAESLLGLLPYFLHPNPEHFFIVGLGAGTTLSAAALTEAKSIQVVELEPAMERATDAIFKGGLPVLNDPRVELVFDDARHRLLVNKARYDAIISQPSHPWLMGSSNLFTKEYFQLVSSRLNRGGIAVQWVNLFNIDSTTLKSIFNAYFDVFPHGMSMVIQEEQSLLLIGSNEPLYFDIERINQRLSTTAIQVVLSKWAIYDFNDLMAYFALSRAEALAAAAGGPKNTDTSLIPEVRSLYPTTSPDKLFDFLFYYFRFSIADYLQPQQRDVELEKMATQWQQRRDPLRYRLLRQQMRSTTEP